MTLWKQARRTQLQVDVYARTDEDKESQYLILPEGRTEMPLPALGKTWRKLFAMSTNDNLLEVPTTNIETTIQFKGFVILRPERWSKDWSEISDEELEDLSAPDAWQDKWHLA